MLVQNLNENDSFLCFCYLLDCLGPFYYIGFKGLNQEVDFVITIIKYKYRILESVMVKYGDYIRNYLV